jgi:hypothetical protein
MVLVYITFVAPRIAGGPYFLENILHHKFTYFEESFSAAAQEHLLVVS